MDSSIPSLDVSVTTSELCRQVGLEDILDHVSIPSEQALMIHDLPLAIEPPPTAARTPSKSSPAAVAPRQKKGKSTPKKKSADAADNALPPGEKYVGTLATKSGQVVHHQYEGRNLPSPIKKPGERFKIKGIRGGGKQLIPPLTSAEKRDARESVGDTPPKRIRRRLSPSPIKRAGGMYESEEEKTPKKSPYQILLAKHVDLREAHERLRDHVAEIKDAIEDLKDAQASHRRSTNSKIKRLFKDAGKEDEYDV